MTFSGGGDPSGIAVSDRETAVSASKSETSKPDHDENFVLDSLRELIEFTYSLDLPKEKQQILGRKIQEMAGRLGERVSLLKKENADLYFKLTHEPKTGLLNMIGFQDQVLKYFQSPESLAEDNHRRQGMEGCFVFIDLNGMKAWNDRFGYDETDHIIESFAKLSSELRAYDVAARRSNTGDEFIIFLPKANPSLAGQIIARKIYRILSSKPIVANNTQGESEKVPVTFVVGVEPLSLRHPDPVGDPEAFMKEISERINAAGELEKTAKYSLGSAHDEIAVAFRDRSGAVLTVKQNELLAKIA